MGTINEEGFLSPDMHPWIKKHREENKDWFQICSDLNRFALKTILNGVKVHDYNAQEAVAGTLSFRILSSFEGVILLAERGMLPQGQMLLRGMLEALFTLGAIKSEPSLAESYISEDLCHRKDLINKVLRTDDEDLKKRLEEGLPVGEGDLKSYAARLNAEMKAKGIRKLTVKDWAERSGLPDFYYCSQYPILCSTVHSRVRSLEIHLGMNESGRIEKLKWGPDVQGVDKLLVAAADFMFRTLAAVNDIFGLDIQNEWKSFAQRFNSL